MEHSSKEIIFRIDEKNKKCADCLSDNPTQVSINHGITLCDTCSQVHSQLGPSISYLRPIDGEFDIYLMNYMSLGSNTKFLKSIEALGVDESLSIEQKYRSNALDYYRRNLKAKVTGGKLLDIDFENANEEATDPKELFPEFTNYVLKNNDSIPPLNAYNNDNEEKQDEQKGKKKKVFSFMSKLGKSVVNVGMSVVYAGKNVGHKVGESSITKTIKSGGHKTIGGIKKAGLFVAKKTAPATNQIKKGANFIGHQVKSAYVGVKGKLIHTKTPNSNENAIVVNINDDIIPDYQPNQQNIQQVPQANIEPDVQNENNNNDVHEEENKEDNKVEEEKPKEDEQQ